MITMKNLENDQVELKIQKNTPYKVFLVGLVMLLEALVKETNMSVDDILSDIKRIYLRDNERK